MSPRLRRDRDDTGAVLVEYAFAFPVLMVAVMACLSLLWVAAVQAAVAQAARDGARFASTAKPPAYRTHPDAAAVADRINARLPLIEVAPGDVVVEYAGCPSPCLNPPANTPLKVTVSVDVLGPVTVSATSNGKVRSE